MIKPTIILGPPGTGKTTKLLEIMEEEMARGVNPRRIAFCSFTKKAAAEAADRAKEKFGYSDNDLPYFRTLHSMAFRQLGMKRKDTMQSSDYKVIGDKLNIQFSWKSFDEEGLASERYLGDRYNQLDGLSKAKIMHPKDVWQEIADEDLNWHQFRQYQSAIAEYKHFKKKTDFNDMLLEDGGAVDVDVAIIDEAQDLSKLQWQFVHRSFKNCQRVYIAGDDDQAIFKWAGAAVDYFVDMEGDRVILEQSYRIPQKVHTLAESITAQIHHRVGKTYHPRDDRGSIEWHSDADGIDFIPGSWLLLARNTYHLASLVARVREAGIPYTYRGKPAINPRHIDAIRAWEKIRKGKACSAQDDELIKEFLPSGRRSDAIWHEAFTRMPLDDREYYISLLRRGESLTKEPRIHINTIHGVKGGEADNVVLVTDITAKTRDGMEKDPDSEHRCFYVAITRTKSNLHLISPATRSHYYL